VSRAASVPLVERLPEPEEPEPGLSKHAGVLEANRSAGEDLPEWQVIEGSWWEADDDLTHGARQRLTDRERQVWRSVKVHGMRPADLARADGMDPSTVRSVLRSARDKVGDRR